MTNYKIADKVRKDTVQHMNDDAVLAHDPDGVLTEEGVVLVLEARDDE